jgi:endonuclease/exonuclease/phosphatase family metal-dependent hydrolase
MRSGTKQIQWCLAALIVACLPLPLGGHALRVAVTCDARSVTNDHEPVTWYTGPQEDLSALDRWCRAVGRPIVVSTPGGRVAEAPALGDLVVLTWNAHLVEGDLPALVADLRDGRLTGGQPVQHFVLLLQELLRRGTDVPAFAPDSRSAFAITGGDGHKGDVRQHVTTLGLSMLYVPSMRNGAEVLEDRGNAIVSTERLHTLYAVELPLERQRRVAIGASIDVRANEKVERLEVVSAHFEPLSSPASLWVFRSPRPRQLTALLQVLRNTRRSEPLRESSTVLGGDFNTIQAGAAEDVYAMARAWSRSLFDEDPRRTHRLGRLDYLFFRLNEGWTASTTRVNDKYGSDHHPVLGRISGRRVPQ